MSELNSLPLNQALSEAFSDMANGLIGGSFKRKARIGLTLIGSEHGNDELIRAAALAARTGRVEPVLIGDAGSLEQPFELHKVETMNDGHLLMEKMLDSGELDGCVAMHYGFPLGVSTVGKVVTPATGREMIIATTTGTADTLRPAAMVKNAISGIAMAKACGIEQPTVGILNVDNAAQVERSLRQLIEGGYDVRFTESARADGGALMRGNDLLQGVPDVMVTDSLTGNLMMKVFSSFTTGGSYEASGMGYGPGLGEGQKRLVGIISRASGAPVVAGAMELMADCAGGDVIARYKAELAAARKAGLDDILAGLAPKTDSAPKEAVSAPAETVTDADIGGIDILDIEDAKEACWKAGIFAKTGMGCTGPIVMIAGESKDKAAAVLKEAGFI